MAEEDGGKTTGSSPLRRWLLIADFSSSTGTSFSSSKDSVAAVAVVVVGSGTAEGREMGSTEVVSCAGADHWSITGSSLEAFQPSFALVLVLVFQSLEEVAGASHSLVVVCCCCCCCSLSLVTGSDSGLGFDLFFFSSSKNFIKKKLIFFFFYLCEMV